MRYYLTILFCLIASLSFAQKQSVSGTIIDAKTQEPLIGVSVVENGTSNGVITDIDGNFSLSVSEGAVLVLSYVGYKNKEVAVGKAGNLGTLSLEDDVVALQDVTVTGQLAVQAKTPVAVSQVTALEIEERVGNAEFVEVLKNTPGVHANRGGGAWGDSEITMRGFTSENIGVMINGCPMNDMEWGGTYWSNWQGLSDVTTVMQTQRGMGASKVSNPSVGGSINIVTKGIDAKKGGTFSYTLGNDGYNKILFSASTGLMDNCWALTVLGARTWGDGYVQGTPFLGYSYFVNIAKRINDHHQLSLTAFGAPQWHNQRNDALTMNEWNKVRQYMTGRTHWTRYNPTYGFNQNGQEYNWRLNQFHKPQISLNHVWQIDHKSSLATAVYASIGRGNGSATENGALADGYSYNDLNGSNYGTLLTKYRKADGTFDYAQVYEENRVSEHGSNLVMTRNCNFHNWFGLVSTYTTNFADMIDFYGGIDLRYCDITHKNIISDLFGGEYYLDAARVGKSVLVENRANGKDPAWMYEKLGIGDVCYRNYTAYIIQEGAFAQVELNKDKWSAFVNGAINYSHYWRHDRYYYDSKNATSDVVGFLGGHVKAGFNFNFNENNNVFINGGFVTRVPKFENATLAKNTSNAFNKDAKNEKVASVEVGYGFHNEYVNFKLNGYFTEWMDKFMTKTGTLGDASTEYIINMTGVSAQHMGLEVELQARPTKWLDINGMFSLGNWEWDKDGVKGLAYDLHGNPLDADGNQVEPGSPKQAQAVINMKGVKVGGSAQTTASLEAVFKPFKGFRISGGYTLYARNYAYYSFTGSALDPKNEVYVLDPWKIPMGGQFDMHTSYRFNINKLEAVLSGNVYNLFNQYYVEKAWNPSTTSKTADAKINPDDVYMYFSFGRTYSISLKLKF